MSVRRSPPDHGSVDLRPGVISLDALQNIYGRMSDYGEVTIKCGEFEVDSLDDLTKVPGVRDRAVVELRAKFSDGGTGYLTLIGDNATVFWYRGDTVTAQQIADEVELIVDADLGSPWLRWSPFALAYLAFVGVVSAAVTRLFDGFNMPSALVIFMVALLPFVPAAEASAIRSRPLRVQVAEPRGLKAQVRDKWLDWVVGGLVVGGLLLLLGRVV